MFCFHLFQFSVRDLVASPELRKPLIISLAMHLSQQLSGINAVSSSTTIIQLCHMTDFISDFKYMFHDYQHVSLK